MGGCRAFQSVRDGRAMLVLGRGCDTGAVTTSRVCTLSDGCDACVYRCVIDVAIRTIDRNKFDFECFGLNDETRYTYEHSSVPHTYTGVLLFTSYSFTTVLLFPASRALARQRYSIINADSSRSFEHLEASKAALRCSCDLAHFAS